MGREQKLVGLSLSSERSNLAVAGYVSIQNFSVLPNERFEGDRVLKHRIEKSWSSPEE